MSVQYRIADQILRVDDARDVTEDLVHKYDAFLNLVSGERYAFQREAARHAWRFLVSDKYPDLERLARENWSASPAIRQRHDSDDAYLGRMPLRELKAVSLDLATGTGKSYVMYALAGLALAEGLVDRVLVLCPSLTIEEALLEKFSALAGDTKLATIMAELDAAVTIPGIKRGNETIGKGDICIENIHAVYERTGSSIEDSFGGRGERALVLNDEAHHIFSSPERGLEKKWLKFLCDSLYGFRYCVNVTGTAYVGDDYFPDVVYRYGLKQAIADKVVKRPNYKLEDTYKDHSWAQTYAIHQKNQKEYGAQVKPISIVVTQEIARCVEVWNELVEYLTKKEKLKPGQAEAKVIWVASGIPSNKKERQRLVDAYRPRDDKDSPEKRRKDNLARLREVDNPGSDVEWIVSVSMLTEGWDVQNVFQIVPHESRAFSSKLLIAQVLGRGLRVPPGLDKDALVTINNHEKWSAEIGNLLNEVLEVENSLYWGYESNRKKYLFPLHNLRYEPEQKTEQTQRKRAATPKVQFKPQERVTRETSKYSETGSLAVEIEHVGQVELEEAVSLMRQFLSGNDQELAQKWPKSKLRKFIADGLKKAGQDLSYLSKENLLLLQHSFSPMLRSMGKAHPRLSQAAKDLVTFDLADIPNQAFSESSLKQNGSVFFVQEGPAPYGKPESALWEQYQKHLKQYEEYGQDAGEQAKAIGPKLISVAAENFKAPWNVHYASFEPERRFSELLFENALLFDAFAKMPDRGGYSFPYSYKPARNAKTHTVNENFNPDFFLRVKDSHDILVVEIKADGDDSNRNRAKCRDGLRHFEALNAKLKASNEPWRYCFYFLSPEDFTKFFQRVRDQNYEKWKSSLMQALMA